MTKRFATNEEIREYIKHNNETLRAQGIHGLVDDNEEGREGYQERITNERATGEDTMKNPNVLIIVQARMESTRFPGKVLAPLFGQPMLLHLLDRLRQVRTPHSLVVALPDTITNNDVLCPILSRHGYGFMTPKVEPDDVLSRYFAISNSNRFEKHNLIVRITGDCPFIDPKVVDLLIGYRNMQNVEYASLATEWPEGIDVEIMTHDALLDAYYAATLPSDREHVSPYIWRDDESAFSKCFVPCPLDLSKERWSIDVQNDLNLAELVYQELYEKARNRVFGWREVYGVLQSRHWAAEYRRQRDADELQRNEAYVAQVAAERGEEVTSWEEVGPKN